jgi:hypothetical protein
MTKGQPAQTDASGTGEATSDPASEPLVVDLPKRPAGPWDETEVTPSAEFIDFGCIRLKPTAGVEVRAEVHKESGQVSRLIAVTNGASVFLQPFATPKSRPMWPELSQRIIDQAKDAGQTTKEMSGEFGVELSISDGTRWVGIDGPRWLLRCIYTGAAQQAGGSPVLEAFVRDAIVVRGDLPWPPGDGLPIKMPEGAMKTEETQSS